jgi:hypothetical protein
VTVDEQDQAVQETAFQWSRPYSAELVRSEQRANGAMVLLARHDGYARLGVVHWRGVVVQPDHGWLVWDSVRGTGWHRVDLHWHAAVDASVRPDGLSLSGEGSLANLVVSGGSLEVLRGECAPIRGWRSRQYGSKEATITLRARYEGVLPHEFITCVRAGSPTPVAAAEQAAVAEFRTWAANAELREHEPNGQRP